MPRLRAVVFGVVCSCVMGFGIAPARAQDSSKPQVPSAKSQENRKAQHSSAGTQDGKGQSSSSTAASTAASAADKSYANETLVYEKIRGVMRYESDGTGTKESFARIRVQTNTGVQRIGQIVFSYTAANETLQVKSARVIKPDGSVVTARPEDVVDLNAPVVRSAPMYTDVRQKHLTMPGLAPGDVLEYEVVERIVTPFTPGHFWNDWVFETEAVCLDEELTLDVPADRKLMIKSPEGAEPSVSEQAGRRTYVWKVKNEKVTERALRPPPKKFDATAILSGPTLRPPKRMLFSTFQNWDQVGRWYAGLAQDSEQATAEVSATAKTVTSGARTQLEKAQAIYNYVAQIRYVSLSFGLGRYQPHTAAEVMANRYGDCKDKATLMDALLQSQGIESRSALISAMLPVDTSIPSPQQFDHVINVIHADGKEVWLDSTIGVGPFGYLLPPLRGRSALVVRNAGESKLEETAKRDANPKIYSLSVEALDDTGAKGHVKLEMQGGGDLEVIFRFALVRLSAAQAVEAFRSGQENQGGGSWSEVTSSDALDLKTPLRLEGTFTADDGAAVSAEDGPKLMIMANWSDTLKEILPSLSGEAAAASEPIELGGPKEFFLHVKMPKAKLGSPLAVNAMQEKEGFGEYTLSVKDEEKFVTFDQHLMVKENEVPASERIKYLHFRGQVLAGAGSILTPRASMVVTAKADGSSGAAGAPTPPTSYKQPLYEAAMRADRNKDFAGSAELLRQAVAADPTYRQAWFELGWNYNQMHDYAKAEAALRKAIELDPEATHQHGDLGVALKGQKKYAEAIPEYKKEVELSSGLDWPHQGLGWSYYMTGQYKDAVSELETAAKISGKNPDVQFDLARAYAKNGQTDKAVQAFRECVELEPTAGTQNSVAYEMAENKLDLDEARKYVLTAIGLVEVQMQDVELENLSNQDMRRPETLAAYLDTLGWVDFQRGDLHAAEKYVAAAWQLENKGDLAGHLGQIYEKEGRKQEAIEIYQEGVLVAPKDQEIRDRLAGIVGGDANVDSAAERSRETLESGRKLKVPNLEGLDGMAEFWVVLVRTAAANGGESGGVRIDGTKFISGDDQLKNADSDVKAAKFGDFFADGGDYKILRKVRLECRKGEECAVVMEQGGKGK